MPAISMRRFRGVRPRVNARLLSADEAAVAINTKLWNGKARPFMRTRLDSTTVKAGPIRSIFKYRGGGKEGWFHWSTDVDVVRAPLAGDNFGRVYYTGDGKPRVTDSSMALSVVRNSTANNIAGDSLISIEGPTVPHQIGDPLRINYDGVNFQNVTITSLTPSGSSVLVGVAPTLDRNLNTGRPVTNTSARLPLRSYELGVPAPAAALTTTPTAGAGVTTGTITAISDIELLDYHTEETGDIGPIQSGSAPAIAPHTIAENFEVTSDGQPMEFVMRTVIEMPITHSNETRDMGYALYLDPLVGEDTLLFTENNRIVRPAGVGPARHGGTTQYMDWQYTVVSRGIHAPTPGTYRYRAHIGPIAGLAGDDNDGYLVRINWYIKVRYTNRIRLTLNADHGLEVGDRITLHVKRTESTPVDRELDGRTVEVIAVAGSVVTINGLPGGVYDLSNATWTQSTDTDEELVSRSYVYTYVASISGQEFEGGPSPASAVIDVTDGQPVALGGFINPTTPSLLRDTNFTALRVYRFQPDESGSGSYLFLTELAINTSVYDDTVPSANLGEVLPTTGYELPPDNLVGLIELPEGGAAGFTDKELCFAVPYQLHAYPAAYRRTTHDRIVALIAFGSSVAVCTEGTPWVFTGTDPVEMTSERLEIIQPCMSKRGAIDIGYAGIYPSPEGLMLISVGRADVVTLNWFTADEWRLLNPSSFVATRYGQRYLCFYDATSVNWPDGSWTDELPKKGGFIFDPKEETFVFLDLWASEAWTDPKDDAVYIVQGNQIRRWDADRVELEYRWRSKPFHFGVQVPMARAKVEAKKYPIRFTAIADGEVKWTQTVHSSQSFTLPDGSHSSWAFEIQGENEVEAVYMASSAGELRRVMEGG